MPDHDITLETLELAERDMPRCPACGETTVLHARPDGSIWLECPELERPKGAFHRVLTLAVPHFRREVVAAA